MAIEIGQNMGPYRIVEQLGQGGMATVYKAYHPSLDRHVAIKVLHRSLLEDESFALRFQREAQIVAKLEHPNIVPIYDFAADAVPYIVMKFIEGTTLKLRLKQQPLTLAETIEILNAVAGALSYAHDRGVLHRDVKPSNVMMERGLQPYLADFGLARIVTSGESTMSQDVLIGTPNYISPEQARGDKNLVPATDVYSLGIMLYEIVVGRVPFSGDTPFAVVHDHIYKPLPIPSKVNPSVPPEVEMVLLKALAKDPLERYAGAKELASAFKQAVEAAAMTELSAASLRLELFDTESARMGSTPNRNTDTAPTNTDSLNDAIRAAVAEQLRVVQTQSQTPTPAIPNAMPNSYSTTPPPYLRQQRGAMSSRPFWIVMGIAALIFICIASIWVSLNALNNPIVRSNPALADSDNQPTPEQPVRVMNLGGTDNFFIDPALMQMPLNEIESLLAEHPDDPMYMLLGSFRYLEIGQMDRSTELLIAALNNPQTSAQMFAGAAGTIALRGFSSEAVLLWLMAYHLDPDDPNIRNGAGEYIYRQYSNPIANLQEVMVVQESSSGELGISMDSPFTKTMIAHALLSLRSTIQLPQAQAQILLDNALAQNDAFAETHLVYGDYYYRQGDLDNARASWRFAASFSDAPQWVQREAQLRLSEATLTPNLNPD